MDKTTLVERDVRDGRAFLDALHQAGVPVLAAMWLRLEDDIYKLYLATPMVQEQGPISTYGKMRDVLSHMKDNKTLTFDDLMAVNTTNHFINDFRKLIQVDSDNAVRLGSFGINNQMIKDAVVYRIGEVDPGEREPTTAKRRRRKEQV